MPNLTVLLAPSDQKQPGGNPFAPDMFDYRTSGTFNYFDALNPERRALIDTLQNVINEYETDTLADIFGLEGAMLDEAIRVNTEIYDAPLMSALDRYSPGIMYAAMDFANLPTGAQRRLLENGIIISGLFGLLRPDDLIPNYQLGITDDVPELGKPVDYWRETISPVLNDYIEGRFVWDLLPEAHRNAWEDTRSYEARAVVHFEEKTGGAYEPVPSEEEDIQRGQFVNYVVRETAEEIEDLEEWEDHPDGFSLAKRASEYDDETRTWHVYMRR
ncbi:MAG: peroxide stress protein YaaA [Longimonas sp.]|uniref:peroxide stress protein YaaA n=1 Tax=Longimonas sp. TaxID=2039626 RepID=UPI00334EF747